VRVWGSVCGRDTVPDGDLLGSDEDVFDEQAQDALAFGHVGGVGGVAEAGEEASSAVPSSTSLMTAPSKSCLITRWLSYMRPRSVAGIRKVASGSCAAAWHHSWHKIRSAGCT
jgi:hypothetical protein